MQMWSTSTFGVLPTDPRAVRDRRTLKENSSLCSFIMCLSYAGTATTWLLVNETETLIDT